MGGEAQFPRWQVDGEPMFPDGAGGWSATTRFCPRRQVTPDSVFLLSLFRHYRNGHLYESGGIAAQPARYSNAMQIIEGALNDDHEG